MSAPPPPTRPGRGHGQGARPSKPDDDSSDSGSDWEQSVAGDEEPRNRNLIRSPSNLTYSLDAVSPEVRAGALDAFRDPPRLTLQYCRLRDNVYAFQMTELVHRSVRIGGPGSNFLIPRCSCQSEGGSTSITPCKHIFWLMDRVVKQTHYDQDPTTPIPLTRDGIPKPLADPFRSISTFHLDILASALHSSTAAPDVTNGPPPAANPTRTLEARELLAAVSDCIPEEYRPDIFDKPGTGDNQVVRKKDLEYTITQMLSGNNEFFDYFRTCGRRTDPINDVFRKLGQRIDYVLKQHDTYIANPHTATPQDAEGPATVSWAATHIIGTISLIRTEIFAREKPLERRERLSAARTLVRILVAVVARNRDAPDITGRTSRVDRNLYLRLIGDRDEDFVIGVLGLLPDVGRQFVHNLDAVLESIGVHGAPATFVEKFRSLIARLRSQGATNAGVNRAGSKRQGRTGGQDRDSKRLK